MNDIRNIEYQSPKEFEKDPETWTLRKDDYLVHGEVEDFISIPKLLEDYEEVMKITDIATKNYGSDDLKHWSITGE